MHRVAVYVLLFLALTGEVKGEMFDGAWETPYTDVGTFLFTPSAVKLPVFDLLVLAVFAWAMTAKGARKGRAAPLTRALWVSLGALAAIWVWGMATGGVLQQTLWQLHPFVMMYVAVFLMMATLRTPAHFATLGKVVVGAAVWRGVMLFVFWFAVVRTTMQTRPATLTTHHDSALFVSGIVVVAAWALERRTQRAVAIALGASAFLALAIAYNNRRLAWVSLLGAIAVGYALLPRGRTKRRINLGMAIAAPLLALYALVSWNSTSTIFKPVAAFASMMSKSDASSQTREIENYNLILTLKTNPLIGRGWGHEYDEVSVAISIKEFFAQYRFIPHNSVLGLLAFTGLLGFAAVWSMLPVSTFLLARSHRAAGTPLERAIALAAISEIVVFMNQLYGDMGMISIPATWLVACALAAAGKLPVMTGAWPAKAARPAPVTTAAGTGTGARAPTQ